MKTRSLLPIFFTVLHFAVTTIAQATSDGLEPQACVGVNGFLSQINIASVVNKQTTESLQAEIFYFDSLGEIQGGIAKVLAPREKFDVIVNQIGLQPESIGTVCVKTNATESDRWFGGVSIYKPNFRSGNSNFGDSFDFVLYYPFLNPLTEEVGLPLNTYHIGVPQQNLVANWISIYDATPGDSIGVSGELVLFDQSGNIVRTYLVDIPDGGRADFAGHEAIAASAGDDALGLATFRPNESVSGMNFHATITRYFYDCPGSSCLNFRTALAMPRAIPSDNRRFATVSTAKGEVSVIELSNISSDYTSTQVQVFDAQGTKLTTLYADAVKGATTHLLITEGGGLGALKANRLGSADLEFAFGTMAATSVFYHLEANGLLSYAYAAPFAEHEVSQQLSEFNSFISHQNELELTNVTESERSVRVQVNDPSGAILWNHDSIRLPSRATKRITLLLPGETYGTISIHSDQPGVFARSVLSRAGQYSLAFNGLPTSGLGGFDENLVGTFIAKSIRIMPLGDSITSSQNGQNPYRYWLDLFFRPHFHFNYVGSRFGVHNGQPANSNFDQRHEGHSGWRTDEILRNISGWARQSNPDIVLIHLGTNDVLQNRPVSSAVANLELIIDRLRAQNPLVKISLAQLIPNNRPSMPILLNLNQQIAQIVARKSTPTSPVILADHFTGYNSAQDNYDGLHPGNSGSQKMAGVWLNSLFELLMVSGD